MTSKQRIVRIRRWLATCGGTGFLASAVHCPGGNRNSRNEDCDRWIDRVERADFLMSIELEWLLSLASDVCPLTSGSGRCPISDFSSEVCHLSSEVGGLESSSDRQPRTENR